MAATRSYSLGYNVVHFGESQMFQSKILPPSSGSKSKLREKSAHLAAPPSGFLLGLLFNSENEGEMLL
jgi:hypothetical protein